MKKIIGIFILLLSFIYSYTMVGMEKLKKNINEIERSYSAGNLGGKKNPKYNSYEEYVTDRACFRRKNSEGCLRGRQPSFSPGTMWRKEKKLCHIDNESSDDFFDKGCLIATVRKYIKTLEELELCKKQLKSEVSRTNKISINYNFTSEEGKKLLFTVINSQNDKFLFKWINKVSSVKQ